MHRTAAAVKLLIHALVRPASGVVPQAERSNRNQPSNCNQRGVQPVLRKERQPDLRKVDHLLGLQSRFHPEREEGAPPHQQVLAAAAVNTGGWLRRRTAGCRTDSTGSSAMSKAAWSCGANASRSALIATAKIRRRKRCPMPTRKRSQSRRRSAASGRRKTKQQ
jgi:hypothetical protein